MVVERARLFSLLEGLLEEADTTGADGCRWKGICRLVIFISSLLLLYRRVIALSYLSLDGQQRDAMSFSWPARAALRESIVLPFCLPTITCRTTNLEEKSRDMASFITYRVQHRGSPRLGMTNWCIGAVQLGEGRNPKSFACGCPSCLPRRGLLCVEYCIDLSLGPCRGQARGGWKGNAEM